MKCRLHIAYVAILLLSIIALPLAAQSLQSRIATVSPALINGQAAEAKRQLTKALQEYREKKDVHSEAITLLFLGLTEMALHNVDGARSNLEDAAKTMRAQDDAIGTWIALIVMSQLDQALGRSPQALADLEEAFAVINRAKASNAPFTLKTFLALLPDSALPPGMKEMLEPNAQMMKPMILEYFLEPITHNLYGSVLTEAGQLEKAEAELNAAVEESKFFQGMYDFSIAAHFGDLRYHQQRYDEARTQYQKALSGSMQSPMNPVGDQWIRVSIYDRLARLETITGHVDEAMKWSDKSLEIAREAGIPVQVCVTLETRGQLLMRSERFADAEGAFNEAMKIADTIKDIARQASIESHIGSLQILLGKYGSAASHLERSVHLYQSLNDPLSEAAVWGTLAHAYLLTDNLAAAEDALAHAHRIAEKAKFPFGVDMIAMTETWLRFRKGQATVNDVKASLERFMKNPQVSNIEIAQDVEQIVRRTLAAIEKGDFSVSKTKSSIPNVDIANRIAEGMQEMDRGNSDEARKIWRTALEKASSSDMRLGLQGLIGASYWKESDFEQASQWFLEATKSLELTSDDLSSEMQIPFLGSYHHTYYDVLIESLLRSGKIKEAFEATERARARAFLRLLGNHRLKPPARAGSNLAQEAEKLRRMIANWEKEPQPGVRLEDLRQRYESLQARVQATSPEYASMTRVEPLSLDTVQRELPEDTTLISYFVTPFGVNAWLLDAETMDHVRLNVSTAQLSRVTCWAYQLSKPRSVRPTDTSDCGVIPAKPDEAYAALIAPLRSKIRQKRLMIIPHGNLHYVPFAALYNAESGKYLVEEYPITYVPSASTLQFLHGKETPVDGGALVLGDPATRSQPDLPGARKEAENVARMLHTKAKLGKDASKNLLYHLNGKVDLLHIAAHAGYDATSPLFSAIYLADGGGKDGSLNVDEIQSEVDLSGVNLVVLSACQSGVGKRSGGDEIVGLTRSILYAGSPGVISTLWNISDEATTPMIEKFYDHLLDGIPAAEALQLAQTDLLRDPKYADPRFWAAFLLTGDPIGKWKR